MRGLAVSAPAFPPNACPCSDPAPLPVTRAARLTLRSRPRLEGLGGFLEPSSAQIVEGIPEQGLAVQVPRDQPRGPGALISTAVIIP